MNRTLLISSILYLISCCLPALEFKNSNSPNDVMLGLRALAVGWSGIFAGVLAWYANPVWLAGVIFTFLRKPTPALLCGIVAVIIACTTFSVIGRELPADEGGVTKTAVVKLLPGCYLWMTSIVLLPLAALLQKAG